MGHAVTVLDGQNMRRGISRDLGFTVDDRSENLRRTAEVAKLMNDAGLICLAAFLAPQEEVRQKAAEVVGRQKFLVVHLDAPVEVCRARDQEGLYAAADSGEIANFPGVSAPYEVAVVARLGAQHGRVRRRRMRRASDRVAEIEASGGVSSLPVTRLAR